MAEKKRKRIVKPKEVKQDKTVDGLNVSFEEAMQFLSKPVDNSKSK